MESLGTSPKRNDGGDGRPWGVAAQSWATAPATLTEKRAMKKKKKFKFKFIGFKKNYIQIQIHWLWKKYIQIQ